MLLETELVVDAFVDEELEVTGATGELVDAFADEELDVTGATGELVEVTAATAELVAAFVEEDPALVVVEETGADADPDEEPDAARAGTAAPTRIKMLLIFILTIESERLLDI